MIDQPLGRFSIQGYGFLTLGSLLLAGMQNQCQIRCPEFRQAGLHQ
jgi:hypothetical protein